MLPKSRVLSALLVGLGLALLVAGMAAPLVLKTDGRMPLDLKNTTWTITDDNALSAPKYDAQARPRQAPVSHQLHMQIQAPADEESATVRIGSSWLYPVNERLISAQTWSYVIDRVTGLAQSPASLTHTIGMPPAEVPVEGHWLKFPADVGRSTYDVFDETLRRAYPAVFVEETELDGREILHFRQEIAPTNVATSYADMFNTRVVPTPEGGTEQTYLHHGATRDLWVDQITGLVVDADVRIDDYYATVAGERTADVLVFEGSMDEAQTAQLLSEVSHVSGAATSELVRWIIVALGALLAVAGLAGAFSSRGGGQGRRTARKKLRGSDETVVASRSSRDTTRG